VKLYKISYLKKVVRIAKGASFGELALLTTKPRSSTIKAVTKTDLAILNKKQFKNIFSKVNQKILNHNIEHTFSWQEVLYKEGRTLDHVFFITSGEFEISKRIDLDSFSISLTELPKPTFRRNWKIVSFKICTVKANEMVGIEEVLLGSAKYITTVTWISKKGKVIQMNSHELFSKNKNPDTVASLKNIGYNKIKFLYERIHWYKNFKNSIIDYRTRIDAKKVSLKDMICS